MHDQFWDMGKKIVEMVGGNQYEMSRLWSWNILKNLDGDGNHKVCL